MQNAFEQTQGHLSRGSREGQELGQHRQAAPKRALQDSRPLWDDGMAEYYFPSDDGILLEGWYIPAKGGESDKLIIFNHALPMCRAGFPGHLGEPWSTYDAVEIDFVIQQKHLSDAGYNVLAYDIRNHGTSSAANGGISGIGRWEWRDCVGVKKYVDSHPALSEMTVGLYSQCMGGNSQYEAITGGQIYSRTFGACAVRWLFPWRRSTQPCRSYKASASIRAH